MRRRVKPAEVDHGLRPGVTTADRQRIAELDRIRELRRANEILKAASAFFARELDSRVGLAGAVCGKKARTTMPADLVKAKGLACDVLPVPALGERWPLWSQGEVFSLGTVRGDQVHGPNRRQQARHLNLLCVAWLHDQFSQHRTSSFTDFLHIQAKQGM